MNSEPYRPLFLNPGGPLCASWATHPRIDSVLSRINFDAGLQVHCHLDGDMRAVKLTFSYLAPNRDTGQPVTIAKQIAIDYRSVSFELDDKDFEAKLVALVYKEGRAMVDHEFRERFRFDGELYDDPHA